MMPITMSYYFEHLLAFLEDEMPAPYSLKQGKEDFMAKVEDLNGKVVWITGASSGIGKAIAQQCAATRSPGGTDCTSA